MRVILFTHTFLPTIGGRELVVHFLADALTRKGVDARVVGPSGARSARGLRLRYKVHRYPKLIEGGFASPKTGLRRRIWLERQQSWLLRMDWRLFGADLIHAHTTYPAGYVAHRVCRNRIPVVITPHGTDIHEIPEIGHGLALLPGVRDKIREALQTADTVTAISDSIRDVAQDQWKVPPERVVRIDNGVDIHRFDAVTAAPVRKHFQIPAHSPIVLNVGNYTPRKGQDVLVRAAALLRRAVPEARVVIVGRGTDPLRQTIDELGLQDYVILTGTLPIPSIGKANGSDLLGALYAEATVVVSAGIAEGSEGLSLAILEGMAARCPIVATEISGNKDIVRPGYNGVLIPPGSERELAQALIRLLQHPAQCETLAQGARKTAEEHSWDRIAEQYIRTYESLLRRKGARTRLRTGEEHGPDHPAH